MLQLGIIGTGRIAQVHLRGILSGVPDACVRGIAGHYITPELEALAHRSCETDRRLPGFASGP